jgi:tetratricopeptide (TPR) repeat protein
LTNDLTNQAVQELHDEDYKKALMSFEQILDIENIDIVKADSPNGIDTVIMFNAGLAAFNAGEYDRAIKYSDAAAKTGYNGARSYSLISSAYQAKRDTLGALNALKEGSEKYPEDNVILESMIQIYTDLDKVDEAIKYLEIAIALDHTLPRYYFAQGALYEKTGQEQKAVEAYNKAIEIDPSFFNAYYNIGALYYNKGVQQIGLAAKIPANENERYEVELARADEWFANALPFMEKCHAIQPTDTMTLEALKNLYYRMNEMDKYNAILVELGQ